MDESTPNSNEAMLTALSPLATTEPIVRTDQIRPALLNEESNSATNIGVAGAKDSIDRVHSVSQKRTRQGMALQHCIATIAFG